ncbi:hypothetical protein Drose_00845 [Dactylosporangium roseum]|uniref:Uncharacterized protein n=1 Tax=Dactylosporangium roseum TaxID=47989 RepID=A0ABY5Z4D3_9ACTN|nr:hypothetical protein [Dactylosporangium roseum]UWZ36920.1 hypothetical protein Drose_00845 [Dactylosporangium roseum]
MALISWLATEWSVDVDPRSTSREGQVVAPSPVAADSPSQWSAGRRFVDGVKRGEFDL